ncbi:MAG: hypothetical protein ACOCUR_02870 [Nanoarchaeota archaeon]
MKARNTEKKQESNKEHKGIFDCLLEKPLITSLSCAIATTTYTTIPKITEAYSQENMTDFLLEEGWTIPVQITILALIANGLLKPMSRFKTPKFKNLMKAFKLEKKVKAEFTELEKEGKLNEVKEEAHSCFDNNITLFYAMLSDQYFNHGRYEEGIDNLVSHLRISEDKGEGLDFIPLRESLKFVYRAYNEAKYAINKLTNRSERDKKKQVYNALVSSLSMYKDKRHAMKLLARIEKLNPNVEDSLALANIMNYLFEPSESHWTQFFSTLEENLRNEGKTLEEIVDSSADTRNKVLRLRNIFMKEYENKENLAQELTNLKHFSKLSHVVSRAIPVEFSGKDYLITPFSGITFFNAMKELSLADVEIALDKSIINLEEIHIHGTKLRNEQTYEGHYTERVRELLKPFIPVDEEFLESYNNTISKTISNAETAYYKDSNPRNILYEEGIIREIDFEKNLLKPHGLDLVSLLEFEAYIDDKTRKALVEKYYSEMKRNLETDIEGFRELYEYCRVQRHLELAGYRARKGNPTHVRSRAKYHIREAIRASENILSYGRNDELKIVFGMIEKAEKQTI